jgi:hypothetical protein
MSALMPKVCTTTSRMAQTSCLVTFITY